MDSTDRRDQIQSKARTKEGAYLGNDLGYAISPIIEPIVTPVKWFESPYPKINNGYWSDWS